MNLANNFIIIKKLTMRHVNDFFSIFNNPEISHYSIIPYPLKITWVRNYIKKSMEKFDTGEKYTWGIFKRGTEQFVGVVVLRNVDIENKSARIGYSIGKNFWNMGFTKMAVKIILNYAFKELNLNRIEIRIDCIDDRSIKLLEELNAKCEGKLRSSIYRNGKFYDLFLYSILKTEYLKGNAE
ncbi:MAG: hypothetical protein A2086_03810 [Spirochaetes bacterium GWD1_27_9]|nr:MAG: hypothetical protein A2Y34_15200 [Spirochaetes bacterium GWC1_27_15]OHD30670.1 MAG: hypothetical protein A2086_03810 [Spirochaetes bacterium GWD1_27_9]